MLINNMYINNNNKIELPKQLTKNQLEALKMQLIKLNLHNKLLLTINKKIHNYPHNKINDKMGSSFNQNITYNFSKNTHLNNNNNNNNFKYTTINNSSRIGIINFVIKIITSIFNSLYCIIAKPQFINKHDKLIIRIPYYQNNVQKDALFTNTNYNSIFNSLINNLSNNNNNKVLINNMLKTNNSNNITKNSLIKWLKDFLNLNINNLNDKIIDFNTIENYTKNDKIIDNKLLNNNSNELKGRESKETNLLMRIANSNNFDYLNTKRLSNLKITSNKLLMLKIINSLNYHNDKSTEILGKGSIAHPVSLNTLDKLFGGVYDSKGYLGNSNFINDYKIITTKLLATNLLNNNNNINNNINIKNAYSKEINTLNKISKNKLMVNLKLINSINQKFNNLKSQYTEKNNDFINFILNNIIKQFNPNILFYNTLLNNKNNSIVNLLLLNRQLSLVNKLGSNLLTTNKINNNNNNLTSKIDYAKFNLNIKIIKLIIKNNIILANTFNNNSNNFTQFKNNTQSNYINNENLFNKIKEAFLSFESYNNKAHNNNNLLKNNIVKFKWLGILLSNIFKKNISIELIRLWNVGLEPTILSKIISKNSVTDKSSVIFKKLWRKISINKADNLKANSQNAIINGNNFVYDQFNLLNNSLLNNSKANLKLIQVNDFIKDSTIINTNPIMLAKTVGISVKIAGRLATERIAPKRTTKSILVGSTEKGRGNVVDSYKFTSKNKRGAYSITVKLAHARTYSTNTW